MHIVLYRGTIIIAAVAYAYNIDEAGESRRDGKKFALAVRALLSISFRPGSAFYYYSLGGRSAPRA